MEELYHRYSNNITNEKILIIGPYPPPLGGVAIHIKRVKKKLEHQSNIVHIGNTGIKHSSKLASCFHLCKKLWQIKPTIVYYHEPTESVQKLFVVTLIKIVLRYTLIAIDHDCRNLYHFGKLKRLLFHFLIQKTHKNILIGTTTKQCYLDNKLYKSIAHKISIESPFLPPTLTEESFLFSQFPKEVHTFVATHTPLITATVFAPILYNNQDLYGFDFCIELIKKRVVHYPKIGLLFGICKAETPEQKDYFFKITQEILQNKLENNFYFLFNQNEFWPLIARSDLFVRPTRSDSFGISVQEAIHVNTPAIASDVCTRPPNTILFQTGNCTDFIEKVTTSLTLKVE